MRTSRFAAKVAIAAASLTLLGAAPATAASAGVQDTQSTTRTSGGDYPRYHSTFDSKWTCEWQARINTTRGLPSECRAVRDGAYRTKWQLWILNDWYW